MDARRRARRQHVRRIDLAPARRRGYVGQGRSVAVVVVVVVGVAEAAQEHVERDEDAEEEGRDDDGDGVVGFHRRRIASVFGFVFGLGKRLGEMGWDGVCWYRKKEKRMKEGKARKGG